MASLTITGATAAMTSTVSRGAACRLTRPRRLLRVQLHRSDCPPSSEVDRRGEPRGRNAATSWLAREVCVREQVQSENGCSPRAARAPLMA